MAIYKTNSASGNMIYGFCDKCEAETGIFLGLSFLSHWAKGSGWKIESTDMQYNCICPECQNEPKGDGM